MTQSELDAIDGYSYGSEYYGAGILSNPSTGIGVAGDPSLANQWTMSRPLTDEEIETMSINGLVYRMLSSRPFDALRNGWQETVDARGGMTVEEIGDIKRQYANYHRKLKTLKQIRRALISRNQWGHAIIVAETNDLLRGKDYSSPLDTSRLFTVHKLRVFGRPCYTMGPLLPPGHRKAGEPAYYDIADYLRPEEIGLEQTQRQYVSQRVHHSRVFWIKTDNGLSDLQSIRYALENFFSAIGASGTAMRTWSFGKWSIAGLVEKMSKSRALMSARIRLQEQLVSMFRGIVVDKGNEEYEMMGRPMTGFAENLGVHMQLLPAFTGSPASVIYGNDPPGFGNGQALIDRNNQMARLLQTEDISYILRWIDTLIAKAADGPMVDPSLVDVEFNPIVEPTPKEQAEVRNLNADTAKVASEVMGRVIAGEQLNAAIGGKFEFVSEENDASAKEVAATDEVDGEGQPVWATAKQLADELGTTRSKIRSLYMTGQVTRRRRSGDGGGHQYKREQVIDALEQLVEDASASSSSTSNEEEQAELQ